MLLAALAIAPCLAIMIYIYFRDKYDKEPLSLLLMCFFFGFISTIPAVVLESIGGSIGFDVDPSSAFMTAIYAYVVVGFSEEISKFFFINKYAYKSEHFDEPYDGITYSVMVGMGFAAAENLLYVFNQESYGQSISVGLLRMFTAIPAHATFAVIMGYFLGIAKFKPENTFSLKVIGILGAVIMHGSYDYFLFMHWNIGTVSGALVSLAIFIYLSFKAIRIHQKDSPFKDD